MFLVVSVCLSTGHPCTRPWPQPSHEMFKLIHLGSHCTGTPWTYSNLFILDLTVQRSPLMFKFVPPTVGKVGGWHMSEMSFSVDFKFCS